MRTSKLSGEHESYLCRLAHYLSEERYSRAGSNHLSLAKRFLKYLDNEERTIQSVQVSDVEKYVTELKQLRRSSKHKEFSHKQRVANRSAIHMLLRLVHGQWPLATAPSTEPGLFHHEITKEYDRWMADLRGLCSKTRSARCSEAIRFLEWLGDRGARETLSTMTVADIDGYVQWRVRSLRQRASKKEVTVRLRSFLRYLHDTGRIAD